MNTTKLIAAIIVISLIGLPTVSFARARGGGYGGGYSSGSRSSRPSGSMGSRGSRTYDQNGAKPIEQSTTPRPSATAPPSATGSPAPTAQPDAYQAALVYATQSSDWLVSQPASPDHVSAICCSGRRTASRVPPMPVSRSAKPTQTAGASSSTGILLLLMLLGAGAFYYFLKVRRSPVPDFSGITRSSAVSGSLLAEPSATTLRTSDG